MSTPLHATDPGISASVIASAGTGKTWLLVTRMLRALLGGAEPGGLLAVTFTKRAAGEMQARLLERARLFAVCDDDTLADELGAMGVAADPATARDLFERLLAAPWPPRVMTFHAFCQDLLARFPLEAGVAPGFELLANERELHDAAWEALVTECGRNPDGAVAGAVDRITDDTGSLDAAHGRLQAFIAHRSDWWAWTSGHDDPLDHALQVIAETCGFRGDEADTWLTDIMRARIKRFCLLVGAAPTAAVAPLLEQVSALLARADTPLREWCEALDALTLVDNGKKPRAQLVKKEITRTHGADAVAEVEKLQHALIAASADWQLARVNHDWLVAGERLLGHYQRLKAEERVLDFADLEWLACRLLNESDQAQWIQYRLDRRIDHVLVDEFQDTNPTQWRMLQPLLAEIAAGGDGERPRSAFIVGDPKQAIYGFRRADARLLDAASTLLHAQLGAPRVPLEGSRRSATAIMDCVNAVFPEHAPHHTHLPGQYGRVEWLPVEAEPDGAEAQEGLRNPLHTPRSPGEALRGIGEARVVAARIRALVEGQTPVVENGVPRPLGWDDVMVLVRARTRLPALEQALREAHIPYASDNRGMLLDRPEILDLVALLEFLTAPWNNLQLARLLKSPLFGCSDQDLMSLAPADARGRGSWYDRLRRHPALAHAAACLERWRERADLVPVHDLLDEIYAEGNVLARYRAASPPHLRAAVAANLVQFLQLALDADAGRYPTLHRLVERLERTREAAARDREFDDAPVVAAEGRVRVMTVHSAKGLEAPVVFLAQTDVSPRGGGLRPWVDWPSDAPRPRWMMLARADGADSATVALRASEKERARDEESNLLYVALTRARQYLFISGMPDRGGEWYTRLATVFAGRDNAPFESGVTAAAVVPARTEDGTPDPALAARLQATPARAVPAAADDAAAAEYGVLVHAALELADSARADVLAALARASGRGVDDPVIVAAADAAERVLASPDLGWLYDPARYQRAWNEARLASDADGNGERFGIVDRLVVTDDAVWVIDYKTHPDPLSRLEWLRELHRPQLERYRGLAAALWPGREIKTALLFTAVPTLEIVTPGDKI